MRARTVLVLLLAAAAPAAGTVHILFAFVDHFEPIGGAPGPEVNAWVDDYMAMAARHRDGDGRPPIHSYFVLYGAVPVTSTSAVCVPAIDPNCLEKTLVKLNEATYAGYGEVEFHCHHGLEDETLRTEDEATRELIRLMVQAQGDFNRHGALITAEPVPRFTFGFIHGEWALDNSRLIACRGQDHDEMHRQFCGVNRELALLRWLGAYGDFTFPAWGSMEPAQRNSIFYAADDELPASYKNWANLHPVQVGLPPSGDLMIVEGPSFNDNVGPISDWATLGRMRAWVSANIHVTGRDDWIFVKVHTHGCAASVANPAVWDLYFGWSMDQFYRDIESAYNDGSNWKLHYVSAREMYNIIKAAEAGKTGDPDAYRDFLIPPYANMKIWSPHRYRLVRYDPRSVLVEVPDRPASFDMSFREFPPGSCVFEADSRAGPWRPSDALRFEGQFGELRLFDYTPSACYCIAQPP